MAERVAVAGAPPVTPRFGMIDLALLSMTVIWGMNAVIVKVTYAQIPPMAFMTVRFVLAGSLLLAVLWRSEGSLRVPRHEWLAFIVAGMVGTGFYQPLFLTGLSLTSASTTSLIIATSPAFVALINRMVGREVLPLRGWIGIVLTFIGVVLIIQGGDGVALTSQALWDDLQVLIGAFLWALYAVLAAPLMVRHTPLRVTALTTSIGAAPLIIIGAPSVAVLDWNQVNAWGWSGVLYSAVFAIVVAYIIWNSGVKQICGARTALYTNLIPVVGAVSAAIFLGEALTPLKIAGAVVIFAGLHLARTARG